MYKARLKQGKRIEEYLQTTSWQEIEERFNGRTLQAEESFEVLWFVDVVYRCPGGATILIQDQRNVSDEPTVAPDIFPENLGVASAAELLTDEPEQTD